MSIQKAIDYAFEQKADTLCFPKGNYLISRTVVIAGSNLVIRGENKTETILIKNGNPGWWGDLMIVCGWVPGNKYVNTHTGKDYFYKGDKKYANNIVIRDLSFKSTTKSKERINNLGIVNSSNLVVDNCLFLESANTNIAIINDARKFDNKNILIKNSELKNARTNNMRVLSMEKGIYNANSVAVSNTKFVNAGISDSKELQRKDIHLWYRSGRGSKEIKLTIENSTFDETGVVHTSVNADNLKIINSTLKAGYVISNNSKLYPNSKVTIENIKTNPRAVKDLKGIKKYDK